MLHYRTDSQSQYIVSSGESITPNLNGFYRKLAMPGTFVIFHKMTLNFFYVISFHVLFSFERLQPTFPSLAALTVLATLFSIEWYIYVYIHTFTDCGASRPGSIRLTNTFPGTHQLISCAACISTTGVVC